MGWQGCISVILEWQGKLDDAELVYNKSLQVKVFGESSLDVANMQKNIADGVDTRPV